MRILLTIIGLFLVIGTLVDAVWTTLTLNYAGPITTKLCEWFERLVIPRGHLSFKRHLFWVIGPLLLVLILSTWILLLWVGWTLVFMGGAQAVVEGQSGDAAGVWERVYFAGYTFITLGIGDYRPVGAVWQVATAISAITGFVLVTLAITYVLPVLAAAVEERQLSFYISCLGGSGERMVLNSWNGRAFEGLENCLTTLAPMLALLAERHLAYPILYYFTSSRRESAIAPNLAAFDDALTLLAYGVAPDARPPRIVLQPVQESVGKFLQTVERAFVTAAAECPPPPPLEALRREGIPCRSDQEFLDALKPLENRRRLLLSHLFATGWSWEGVRREADPAHSHLRADLP